MAAISTWSKTPANNDQAVPNGWPEGQLPSSVNNCARQDKADIRTWYENPIWIDYGATISYASASSFRLTGDLTTFYDVSRRIKVYGMANATYYGSVTDVTYVTASAITTVTVAMDDNTSLTASLSQAWYSALDPQNNPLPEGLGRQANVLVAGDFTTAPWQQGESFTTSVSTGAYYVDNWILLSEATDTVKIERHTDKALKATVVTSNKKFGFVQWFENKKTISMADFGYGSILFEAKASAAMDLKIALVKWTSTADGFAKDMIGAGSWGGTGTDPTLLTFYAYENSATAKSLPAAGAYQTFKIENIPID